MFNSPTFEISALWQAREETPAAIADRLNHYIALSRPAYHSDINWLGGRGAGLFNPEREPQRVEAFVAERIARDDDASPYQAGGYAPTFFFAAGHPHDQGEDGYICIRAGARSQNGFKLFTDRMLKNKTDPRLVTYDAMRTNMMSAVWAFEPDWCSAGPVDLMDYFDMDVYKRPPVPLAWMIWLKPSLAAQIKLPHQSEHTIVEHYADGSLFMATSKDTFDCGNHTHLRRARVIHRQIDPLNYTEPFCGISGRSDRVPPFPKL